MHPALEDDAPELLRLKEALLRRKSAFQLKGRLLRGVGAELKAAKDVGLTWRMIWQALRQEGYPGGYQQFCKAGNRVLNQNQSHGPVEREILPPLKREKDAIETAASQGDRNRVQGDKPEWQQRREEAMEKLDREAEQNRQREARLSRPKVFHLPPFLGRGEE